ncbi:MAG: sensor histidine kinase [Cyclobacteriaceae bacterium]
MIRSLLFFIASGFILNLYGQSVISDDSIQSLIQLSDDFLYSEPKKSKEYAHQALELSAQNSNSKLSLTAMQNYSVALRYANEYDSALALQNSALDGWFRLADTLEIAGAYNNLGVIYDERGYNQKAIERYMTSLNYYELINDEAGKAKVYNNLGIVHKKEGNYHYVREYYSNALKIYQGMGHALGEAITTGNLGSVFLELEQYDSVIYYSDISIELYEKNGIAQFIPYSIENIGIAHRKLGNLDEAGKFHKRALELYLEYGNKKEAAFTNNSLAEIALQRGDLTQAKSRAKETLKLAKEVGVLDEQKRALETLYKSFEEEENYQNAFNYITEFMLLKDSTSGLDKTRVIEELQAKYELEQKDKEIKLLKAESEIQELRIRSTRNTMVAILVVTGLLIILAYLFFARYKYKQKAILAEEKERLQSVRFRAVVDAEEKERKRIAQELHDGLGQLLSTARITVSSLDNGELPKVTNSLKIIDMAVKEVRNISHNMMPNALVNVGLQAALEDIIRKINEAGDVVGIFESNENIKLQESQSISMYRIAQESINNALKYADATELKLSLTKQKDFVILTISDNGRGFDVAKISESKGIGWKNIQYRADMIDAKLEVTSKIGHGTRVKVTCRE